MLRYSDIHHSVADLTEEALADVHHKDLEKQAKYAMKYLEYWFDEASGKIFCLIEAPGKQLVEVAQGRSPQRVARPGTRQ